MSSPKSLTRSQSDRLIAGVCGGLAEYFNLDSTLIRFLFIAIILLGGSGILIYLILWIFLPNQSTPEATMKKETDHPQSSKSTKSTLGLFLIGLGILLLLENFGIGRYLMLQKTWPSIFIILGLLVLAR